MKYNAHFYTIVAGSIVLFLLVIYGFCYDHKTPILRSSRHEGSRWWTVFTEAGIPEAIVEDISHDDDTWYYMNSSTCVGYGGWTDRCPRNEVYCGGHKNIGTAEEQARAVLLALKNGGKHPECPLLYPGAN